MSKTTARGVGDAFLATTTQGDGSGSNQWTFPQALFNFEETVDTESTEAQSQVQGELQTAEAGRSTTTRTLTLTTQIINTNTRPLIYNQLPKTFSADTIQIRKDAILDATEKIEDAAITAANLQQIRAFKDGFGRLTPTADASTAPASASEVQIDTTNSELVFFAGEEGETINYTIPTPFTSAKGFGGPGAKTALGRLEFRCAVFGLDGSLVEYRYYPLLDLVSEPSQSLSGGIPELTLEYRVSTPSGWSDPYQVIEADTIVV